MAEDNDSNQDQGLDSTQSESLKEEGGQAVADEDSDEISLDDIDALISEAAPEFDADLQEIESSDADREGEDLSEVESPEEELTFVERFPKIAKIFAPFGKIGSKVKGIAEIAFRPLRGVFAVIGKVLGLFTGVFKVAITWLGKRAPSAVNFLTSNTKDLFSYIFSQIKYFLSLPVKAKVLAALAVTFSALTLYLAYQTTKGVWLPIARNQPVPTFSKYAEFVGSFVQEPKKFRLYHRAFPQPEFTMLLKHLVVSLRRKDFDSTPMAAFEFYLNLDSQDTAIEVKDREPQLLDLIQRTIEEYTFNELNSHRGLKDMKEELKKELNALLNYGYIQDIYIKTKVLKP